MSLVVVLLIIVTVVCLSGCVSNPKAGYILFENATGIHYFDHTTGTYTKLEDNGINPRWVPNDKENYTFLRSDGSGKYAIFLSDMNGAENQLTQNSLNVLTYDYDLSHDGKWIVFVSGNDNNIYKVGVDGKGLIPLTSDGGGSTKNAYPQWSPTGKIAYLKSTSAGDYLYTMDDTGTNQVSLVPSFSLYTLGAPNWDLTGDRITFSGRYSGPSGVDHIYVIDVNNGKGAIQVPTGTGAMDKVASPIWGMALTGSAYRGSTISGIVPDYGIYFWATLDRDKPARDKLYFVGYDLASASFAKPVELFDTWGNPYSRAVLSEDIIRSTGNGLYASVKSDDYSNPGPKIYWIRDSGSVVSFFEGWNPHDILD